MSPTRKTYIYKLMLHMSTIYIIKNWQNLPDCSLSQFVYSNSKLFHPRGFMNWLILLYISYCAIKGPILLMNWLISSFDSYCAIKELILLPNGKWYGHKVQKMIPNMKPSEPGGECYKQNLSMGPLLLNGPVSRHSILFYYYWDYGQ